MRVRFNHHIESDFLYSLTKEESNIHFGLKGTYSPDDDIVVFGIAIRNNKILYLIALNDSEFLMTFVNSKFFIITDNSVSCYWSVFSNINNLSILYPEFDFSNFTFVGIPRFVDEREFFHSYHMGDNLALGYIRNVIRCVLEEDAISKSAKEMLLT